MCLFGRIGVMPESKFRLSAVNPRPVLRNPLTAVSPLRARPAGRLARPLAGFGDALKAGFDLCAAAVLLVAAVPVLVTCVLLVRATSRGPALYTQQRVGRGGR